MKVEYIDLKAQQQRLKPKLDKAVLDVMEKGEYIMGEEVLTLEEKLCEYVGRKHCITTSNGTDALLMALMCSGVGIGDAVFTSAFSFFASAEVISLLGATPIFVDINPNSYNMDSYCLTHAIKKLLKSHTLTPKAVIAVDLFGQCADYENICEICDEYKLDLIEDAAQGFGATYHGKKAGSFGRYSCTSFFPAKPLGCYGDGGAIFCDSQKDADFLRSIRIHGKGENKYDNIRIGLNARLDTIQAAVLLCKLDIFDDELRRRQEIAELYNRELKNIVRIPVINKYLTSCYAQYTIAFEDKQARDNAKEYLASNGVPSNIYYPIPLNKQVAYQGLNTTMPNAEAASNVVLSLPMHAYLSDDEVQMISELVRDSLKKGE